MQVKKLNGEVVKVEYAGHVLHDTFTYYTPRRLVNRLMAFLTEISNTLSDEERRLGELTKSYEESLLLANKPFEHQEELNRLLDKQAELNLALEFHDKDADNQVSKSA